MQRASHADSLNSWPINPRACLHRKKKKGCAPHVSRKLNDLLRDYSAGREDARCDDIMEPRTYHVLVNLVGYNGYVVTSGDVENVKYMVATEHGAAWIRGIVYNNRRRRLVDLRLQVVQINLPAEFRLETKDQY